MNNTYEPIVGLEVHVELKTKSKMFCGCDADYFGQEPNTRTCPVCLALPGALPVPNRQAIEWCIMLGHALNCEIPLLSKFDRKNYFYPDIPKGYQISQYDQPFAKNGMLKIKHEVILGSEAPPESKAAQDSGQARMTGKRIEEKTIRIRRVHMEEDTGKLVHATVDGEKVSLVDFNRSGVALVEIVTEPDIRSSEEARIFLKKLHAIIRAIGISDADMEKGSVRIEPNISVRKVESRKLKVDEGELPAYKVEVKNINSFGFAKKAIDFEVERHIEILENGEIPPQETRGYNEDKGITVSQRSKEEAHDYRYFPEPDIPPIRWEQSYIDSLKAKLPELPDAKVARYEKEYGLSAQDAGILIDDVETQNYFEETIGVLESGKWKVESGKITPKVIANWIINKKADIATVSPEELVKRILAKTQVVQMDAGELEGIIKNVIDANPKAVEDYKGGKESTIMFLVGQVMRESKGRADAMQVKEKIATMLT